MGETTIGDGARPIGPVEVSALPGSDDFRVSGLSAGDLTTLLESDGGTVTRVAASATTVEADRDGLTAREAEIIGLIASGWGNAEVADGVFLSINTVKSYIRSAYRKMGVSTRSQAVLWAVAHGLDGPVRPGAHDGQD